MGSTDGVQDGQTLARFSPTALRRYEQCPRRFAWEYIERRDYEAQPSAQLILGNAVHAALAGLYRLPVGDRCEEAGHALLRSAWRRSEREGAFFCDEEEAEWGSFALEAVSMYCNHWELDSSPAGLEVWVSVPLGAVDAVVFGRVDRVDDFALGGELEVVDYKTGRSIDEQELRHDVGAQVYALAASHRFGRPVRRVRFIYPIEASEIEWEIDSDEMGRIEAALTARVEQIRADRRMVPVVGRHCRWCPFAADCDAGNGNGARHGRFDRSEVVP